MNSRVSIPAVSAGKDATDALDERRVDVKFMHTDPHGPSLRAVWATLTIEIHDADGHRLDVRRPTLAVAHLPHPENAEVPSVTTGEFVFVPPRGGTLVVVDVRVRYEAEGEDRHPYGEITARVWESRAGAIVEVLFERHTG